jgi:hypothetical protein
MTDEGIWLLILGRDWHPYEVIEDNEAVFPAFKRLSAAGRLEGNPITMYVRLRPKEENELIRV